MSCPDNKDAATDDFVNASFVSTSDSIQVLEETQSDNNSCILTVVRGKINLDLTSYHNGTALLYFKVSTQTDGSSNSPPVTANETYIQALSATVGIVNTSGYYGNFTPTFSDSNDCADADKQLGWLISDQVGVVTPRFQYNC
jgi:hypothetical protein